MLIRRLMLQPRSKLIIWLALALVFASVQCVSACAMDACNMPAHDTSPLPPCHRHHGGTGGQAPCGHHILAATLTSSPAASSGFAAAVPAEFEPTLWFALPSPAMDRAQDFAAPSPPRLTIISSTVLRI